MRNAEAALQLVDLQMAEGHGKSIGGVGRFGKFLQAQLRADHELHLAFIGLPVASHTCFDLARRIAVNVQAMFFGGKENYTTHLGQAKGRAHVERSEDGFDSENLRLESANQIAQAGMDVLEDGTGGHLLAFGGDFQGSVMEDATSATDALNHGVSGGPCGGRINTEDTQAR